MVPNSFALNPDILIDAVRNFKGKRILILGDLMLDRFVYGSVSRISPEAPVPVIEIRNERTYPGGAANVAANIGSLGGVPVPIGIVGRDPEAECLRDAFRALGASTGGLIVDASRPTSVKTRIIALHQQVCRTDREDRSKLAARMRARIIEKFRAALPAADAVIVSDYAKGLLSPELLKRTLPLAKASGKIVCVDPKFHDFSVYGPATVLTPNTAEIERASGIAVSGKRDLLRAGRKVLGASGAEHLLITRGEEGMVLFDGDSGVTHIPTIAREVFDVTGAGDTVISALTLSLTAGLPILQAAVLANFAAGIVIGKLGTASATPEELVTAMRTSQAERPRPL